MDVNKITLTGTISRLDNYVKLIPRPIIGFDLQVFRKKKHSEEEAKFDMIKVFIFDDEEFPSRFKVGDRIKVVGELQSRKYTYDNYEINEMLESAVTNYVDLFEETPTKQKPRFKTKEIIEWRYLIESGFIPSVPQDSLYLENGKRTKDSKDKYAYSMDREMILYKETQHVAYEVIVDNNYERLDEPLDIYQGDINKAEMLGIITAKSNYTKHTAERHTSSITIKTKSRIQPDKIFYNHAFLWETKYNKKSQLFKITASIKLNGRLQTRDIVKDITIRKKTPSGNKKKLKIKKTFTTREISIASFEILN